MLLWFPRPCDLTLLRYDGFALLLFFFSTISQNILIPELFFSVLKHARSSVTLCASFSSLGGCCRKALRRSRVVPSILCKVGCALNPSISTGWMWSVTDIQSPCLFHCHCWWRPDLIPRRCSYFLAARPVWWTFGIDFKQNVTVFCGSGNCCLDN